MTTPHTRVNWQGDHYPEPHLVTAGRNARHKRITGELVELRTAAAALRELGDDFHQGVAEWLETTATVLERENAGCASVDLPHHQDTRKHPDYFPSAPSYALRIARAFVPGNQ